MKIATWNINSLTVRLPQVLAWLEANPVDVLALQETKLVDDKFPVEAFVQAGYQAAFFGQRTYNGVALVSRREMADITRNIPGNDDAQTRVIAGDVDGVRVVCAYVPNGQSVDSDKFGYKMRWLTSLQQWLAQELIRHPRLVLCGDFNIAPEDRDVYDPVAWAGQVLCTPQERAHFKGLLSLGFCDAFRLFEQPEKSWSWWDYRNLAFRRNQGLRIDHLLVSTALRSSVLGCVIDKAPRKNERPSDHAPVVLTLADDAA